MIATKYYCSWGGALPHRFWVILAKLIKAISNLSSDSSVLFFTGFGVIMTKYRKAIAEGTFFIWSIKMKCFCLIYHTEFRWKLTFGSHPKQTHPSLDAEEIGKVRQEYFSSMNLSAHPLIVNLAYCFLIHGRCVIGHIDHLSLDSRPSTFRARQQLCVPMGCQLICGCCNYDTYVLDAYVCCSQTLPHSVYSIDDIDVHVWKRYLYHIIILYHLHAYNMYIRMFCISMHVYV